MTDQGTPPNTIRRTAPTCVLSLSRTSSAKRKRSFAEETPVSSYINYDRGDFWVKKRPRKPSVGSRLDHWTNTVERGGEVLEVRPYDGRYQNWFTWIVRVTSPNSRKGWIETVL